MPSLADLPPVAAPAAPAPDTAPAAPAPDAAPAAPAMQLPTPFDVIAAGKLPGLQIPAIQKGDGVPDALQHYVVQNLHVLMQAGIDYHDLPDHTTVLYNPTVVTEAQIQEAYKAGTLDKLVPTAKAFVEHIQKLAAAPQQAPAAPASGLADVPTPGAAPAAGQAAAAPAHRASPPGVNRARLANIAPPGPGIKPNPVPDQLARRAI